MNIDRITNLIRVLRKTSKESFNIYILWDKERVCGCAIGHAIMDDYFRDTGFCMDSLTEGLVPAISKFFGLTVKQTNNIFFGVGYSMKYSVSPADVISKLEDLLEEIYFGPLINEPELELEDA